MDTAAAKKSLRAAILSRLRAKADAQRAADSAALRALLSPILAEMEQQAGRPLCVALYAALPHEVNLLPLLQEHPQHCYAFPRCLPGRQMSFHCVSQPSVELTPGAMGILTPLPGLPLMEPERVDLLLVPGVAFTERGERLGYGGGFYDNFIPRCRRARVLALAFAEQLVETLPTEAHDLRVPQLMVAAATSTAPSQQAAHPARQVPPCGANPPPGPFPAA